LYYVYTSFFILINLLFIYLFIFETYVIVPLFPFWYLVEHVKFTVLIMPSLSATMLANPERVAFSSAHHAICVRSGRFILRRSALLQHYLLRRLQHCTLCLIDPATPLPVLGSATFEADCGQVNNIARPVYVDPWFKITGEFCRAFYSLQQTYSAHVLFNRLDYICYDAHAHQHRAHAQHFAQPVFSPFVPYQGQAQSHQYVQHTTRSTRSYGSPDSHSKSEASVLALPAPVVEDSTDKRVNRDSAAASISVAPPKTTVAAASASENRARAGDLLVASDHSLTQELVSKTPTVTIIKRQSPRRVSQGQYSSRGGYRRGNGRPFPANASGRSREPSPPPRPAAVAKPTSTYASQAAATSSSKPTSAAATSVYRPPQSRRASLSKIQISTGPAPPPPSTTAQQKPAQKP
jgi:hypothetical protein